MSEKYFGCEDEEILGGMARAAGTLAQVDALIGVVDKAAKAAIHNRNLLAEIDIRMKSGMRVMGHLTLSCYGTRRKGEEQESPGDKVENLEVWLGDTEITAELSESTLDSITNYILEG